MNTRKTWWAMTGVALMCVSLAFLFRQPAATAQTKVTEPARPVVITETRPVESLLVKRYQMAMTGAGSSFIVMDTATGHCWLSTPEKREWQDIGAPPARAVVPVVPVPPLPGTLPPPPKR